MSIQNKNSKKDWIVNIIIFLPVILFVILLFDTFINVFPILGLLEQDFFALFIISIHILFITFALSSESRKNFSFIDGLSIAFLFSAITGIIIIILTFAIASIYNLFPIFGLTNNDFFVYAGFFILSFIFSFLILLFSGNVQTNSLSDQTNQHSNQPQYTQSYSPEISFTRMSGEKAIVRGTTTYHTDKDGRTTSIITQTTSLCPNCNQPVSYRSDTCLNCNTKLR